MSVNPTSPLPALVLWSCGLVSCADAGVTGACDAVAGGNICVQFEEIEGVDAADVEKNCANGLYTTFKPWAGALGDSPPGDWKESGSCPSEDVVGSCVDELGDEGGAKSTTFYYAGVPAGSLTQERSWCGTTGGTWNE